MSFLVRDRYLVRFRFKEGRVLSTRYPPYLWRTYPTSTISLQFTVPYGVTEQL